MEGEVVAPLEGKSFRWVTYFAASFSFSFAISKAEDHGHPLLSFCEEQEERRQGGGEAGGGSPSRSPRRVEAL